MARHVRTTIRYDGPALVGHEMDVQDLAPALLALADIIQIANKKFNGDAATMRVLVNADIKQKCFQIDLSLVQSILDQAKTLFASDDFKTAEEIAKWVGIVGSGIGSGAVGLFKLLKWMTKGKDKLVAPTKLKVQSESGSTVILVNGDGNTIDVRKEVYQLASDPFVVEKAKVVVRPLMNEGYETVSFVHDDQPVDTITKDDARDIVSAPPDIGKPPTETVSMIRGPVQIKSPQYVGNAKWTVLWGGKAIDVAMPPDWVREFQNNRIDAPPNTTLGVEMEQKVPIDENGVAIGPPTYTVKQIFDVHAPVRQPDFFTGNEFGGPPRLSGPR